MNKARRQQLKMLKYKARLKKWGFKEGRDGKLYAFRSHGSPCSCYLCQGERYSRAKEAVNLDRLMQKCEHTESYI